MLCLFIGRKQSALLEEKRNKLNEKLEKRDKRKKKKKDKNKSRSEHYTESGPSSSRYLVTFFCYRHVCTIINVNILSITYGGNLKFEDTVIIVERCQKTEQTA